MSHTKLRHSAISQFLWYFERLHAQFSETYFHINADAAVILFFTVSTIHFSNRRQTLPISFVKRRDLFCGNCVAL